MNAFDASLTTAFDTLLEAPRVEPWKQEPRRLFLQLSVPIVRKELIKGVYGC